MNFEENAALDGLTLPPLPLVAAFIHLSGNLVKIFSMLPASAPQLMD